MPYLLSFDTDITRSIFNSLPHNGFFDLFFSFFSLAGGFVVWWIIAVIFLILYEEHRNHRFLLYFTGGVTAAFVISDFILKNIFMRNRPISTDFNRFQPYMCPVDYSFPSAHTTVAFAAAFILSNFDPKRKYIYYFVAVIVSLSRLYLGCHYLGDILAGGLIGTIIGQIVLSMSLSYNKDRQRVHKK